jgi:hypothetical protein
MAGSSRLHTLAASITPAAKPGSARCKCGPGALRSKNTPAAPSDVHTAGSPMTAAANQYTFIVHPSFPHSYSKAAQSVTKCPRRRARFAPRHYIFILPARNNASNVCFAFRPFLFFYFSCLFLSYFLRSVSLFLFRCARPHFAHGVVAFFRAASRPNARLLRSHKIFLNFLNICVIRWFFAEKLLLFCWQYATIMAIEFPARRSLCARPISRLSLPAARLLRAAGAARAMCAAASAAFCPCTLLGGPGDFQPAFLPAVREILTVTLYFLQPAPRAPALPLPL